MGFAHGLGAGLCGASSRHSWGSGVIAWVLGLLPANERRKGEDVCGYYGRWPRWRGVSGSRSRDGEFGWVASQQCSQSRPSRIRLGRVVSDSAWSEMTRMPESLSRSESNPDRFRLGSAEDTRGSSPIKRKKGEQKTKHSPLLQISRRRLRASSSPSLRRRHRSAGTLSL